MTLRNPLPDNSLAEHWDVRLCSLRFNIDFSLSLSLSNMIFSLLRVWTPNNWSSTQTEPFVSLNHFQLFRIIKTVSINFSNIKYISERLKKKKQPSFWFPYFASIRNKFIEFYNFQLRDWFVCLCFIPVMKLHLYAHSTANWFYACIFSKG